MLEGSGAGEGQVVKIDRLVGGDLQLFLGKVGAGVRSGLRDEVADEAGNGVVHADHLVLLREFLEAIVV